MSENSAIKVIYRNNTVEVLWCSVTGKVKVKPGGDWLVPEMNRKSAPEDD